MVTDFIFSLPQWTPMAPNRSSMDDFKGTPYPMSSVGVTENAAMNRKQTSAQIRFSMATYNVMSFTEARSSKLNRHQREQKRRRLQRLRMQFQDEQLVLIGLQGARGREGQQWADGYITLRCGADAGGHGCALLVSTNIPYAMVKE
eukprot:363813-Pyramimonas_sp.AAC.1